MGDGFLVLAGSTNMEADLGKYTAAEGDFVVTVSAGDAAATWGSATEGNVRAVDVDAEGAAVVVGGFSGAFAPPWTSETWTAASADAFAVSFAPDGTHRWTRVHSGGASDVNLGVAFDGRGNVFVSGVFTGEMSVAPRGTLTHSLGSAGDICDGYYLLLGAADGFVVDARQLGGGGCELMENVEADVFGGFIANGVWTGEISLLSGTSYTTEPTNRSDVFLLRVSDL